MVGIVFNSQNFKYLCMFGSFPTTQDICKFPYGPMVKKQIFLVEFHPLRLHASYHQKTDPPGMFCLIILYDRLSFSQIIEVADFLLFLHHNYQVSLTCLAFFKRLNLNKHSFIGI